MKNGKCPHCGSTEVYVSDYPFTDSIAVKSSTETIDTFPTEAYLCLECRHLEIFVKETAVAFFGKGPTLKNSIPYSENWRKAQA